MYLAWTYIPLCEAACDEVIVNDIHVAHSGRVGGETADNLEGDGVEDVDLTSDITAAEVPLGGFEQANSRICRGLQVTVEQN